MQSMAQMQRKWGGVPFMHAIVRVSLEMENVAGRK